MSDRFDWQTDEEKWVGASSEEQPANHRTRRRWLIVPFVLLCLIAIGGLIFWQVQQRVQEAEADRKNDVLSSYQLIREAMLQNDDELFRTQLSGRSLDWAMSQQALFSRGLITDRKPFGLNPISEEIEIVDVELESSFQSAKVIAEHRYTVTVGDGLTETVSLRLDKVFRLGDRWLWAPPRMDYWGGNLDDSVTGQNLTIFFPKRDEDIARRLLQDLDELIARWCELGNQVNCPETLYIQLKLSRDPASLLDLAEYFYRNGYTGDRFIFNGRAYNLTMPTPSLVGIPKDETSYQALLRGYGANVIGALAARMVGQDCCRNETMYHAVIRNQLEELGVMPWPSFSVGKFPDSLSSSDKIIRILCKGNLDRSSGVYLYNLADRTWYKEFSNRPISEIKGMPGGEGMLLLEMLGENGEVRIRIILRQDGTERIFLEDFLEKDEAQSMNWSLQDRDRRLLVEIPDLRQGVSTYYSYDLPECNKDGCPPEVHHLLNTPTWSPDGQQLLVRQYGMIWRQQGLQAIPLADGVAPFWIDDESFGFVRQLGDQQIVITRSGPTEEPVRTLTTWTLLDSLPEEKKPDQLAIGHISIVPGNVGEWIILAFGLSPEGIAGEAFLFNVNRSTDEIYLAFRSEKLHSFNLSPDGQRLAATSYDTQTLNWTMNIYDLSTRSTEQINLEEHVFSEFPLEYNWSPDGDWILLMSQGIVSLIEPELGSYFSIPAPEPGCTQAIWTD